MVDIALLRKKDYFRANNAYRSSLFLLRFEGTLYYNTIHSVYELIDDYGNRNFLFVGDNVYYIVDTTFEFADKVTYFRVDENNNIVCFVGPRYDVVIYNNTVMKMSNNYPVEELSLVSGEKTIIYSQNDYQNSSRCIMFNKYDANNELNAQVFKKPFCVTFNQFFKGTQAQPMVIQDYYLHEWNYGDRGYSLALMKVFGVKKFLNRAKEQESFARYYSKLIDEDNETNLMNLMTSKSYSLEDMKGVIIGKGFKTDVSLDMIDIFNGDNDYYRMCSSVIEEMKDVKPENNLAKVLKR